MTTWQPEEALAWRRRFSPEQTLQRVRPTPTFEYLNNPHKGCATFQRFNGDEPYVGDKWDDRGAPVTFPPPKYPDFGIPGYPPTRLAYCRWLWAVLEPQRGEYRWAILDQALHTAARRGQTLQLRVQPFIRDDLPAWYWDTGAASVELRNTGGISRAPDDNDPRYLEHFGGFIRALGGRYDGDPRLESVDVGYAGSCGECGGNASADTAARLVHAFARAFPTTPLVSMLGTAGCAYAATLDRPFGYRLDCFGDLRTDGKGVVPDGLGYNHMFDDYPREVAEDGVADAWRRAPVTFETCWSVPYWRAENWDLAWILEHGLKYHPSVFMPKSCRIPEQWMPDVLRFCNRIGYWFFLQQVMLPLEARPGQSAECQLTIDNKGVAPVYRRYHLALRFTQADRHHVVRLPCDPRRWMPDYTFERLRIEIPHALMPGAARIACALVDDHDRPAVRLAITDTHADGWHPLTWMMLGS